MLFHPHLKHCLLSGNGRLHQNELLEALKASMEENGMNFDAMELRDLTRAIWEDSGVGESTSMGFEDFKQQLVRHQGLAEGLAKRFEIAWSKTETNYNFCILKLGAIQIIRDTFLALF